MLCCRPTRYVFEVCVHPTTTGTGGGWQIRVTSHGKCAGVSRGTARGSLGGYCEEPRKWTGFGRKKEKVLAKNEVKSRAQRSHLNENSSFGETTEGIVPWTTAREKERERAQASSLARAQVICNDRLGKKIRVKCNEDARAAAPIFSDLSSQDRWVPESILNRNPECFCLFAGHDRRPQKARRGAQAGVDRRSVSRAIKRRANESEVKRDTPPPAVLFPSDEPRSGARRRSLALDRRRFGSRSGTPFSRTTLRSRTTRFTMAWASSCTTTRLALSLPPTRAEPPLEENLLPKR